MEFQGPTNDDLVNISALNRLFLGAYPEIEVCLQTAGGTRPTEAELARLAGVPFLLFSFRERDGDFWQQVLGDDRQLALMESTEAGDARGVELKVAGLSFLWQLVRRNPYAARLVCGATVDWCDLVARVTLVRLLQATALRTDLLRTRFPAEDNLWRRLLHSGISAQPEIRLAAHHSALQAMLARSRESERDRMAAAACNMKAPHRHSESR